MNKMKTNTGSVFKRIDEPSGNNNKIKSKTNIISN